MKVCTLIGISFSQIYISVEAINELLKYLVELMLLMENSVKENGIYIEQKMTMDFAKFAQK